MFQLFRKAIDGHLQYSFGDVDICFSRSEDFSLETEELEDVIELSIETTKGSLEKKATFTYKMKDLAQTRKMRQSRMDSYGE